MATLHPARAHGLADRGAIAPGYRADLVLLDDLVSFAPVARARRRAVAARDGRAEPFPSPGDPGLRAPDRAQRAGDARPTSRWTRDGAERVRVIEIVPEQLITIARERGADGPRRRGGRRPGARPGQDRRDRAPPRDRPRRPRPGQRLRAAQRRVRLDRRPRRAQRRRRRRRRRRHASPAPPGCRRSAAASSSPTAARCAASWRCRSAGLLSDQPVEAVVDRLEPLHASSPSRASTSRRRS